MIDTPPYFSIVIPVYNREKVISRALTSCLSQEFQDYEIIVVDDGSVDNSVKVVQSFSDQRIKLIRHEMNRGVSPTRNTGLATSIGKWIIYLDSDDELVPGGLQIIHQKSAELGEEVACLRFMMRLDSQLLSPDPPLKDEIWDYKGYLCWLDSVFGRRKDARGVVRRDTFPAVRFPDNRALETIYHLDLAMHTLTKSCPEVVQLYHHDGGEQLVRPDINTLLLNSLDQAKGIELVLARHGKALSRWAPRQYISMMTGLATLYFLAGQRLKGVQQAFRVLRLKPTDLKTWGVLTIGLMGATPLAWLKSRRAEKFLESHGYNMP